MSATAASTDVAGTAKPGISRPDRKEARKPLQVIDIQLTNKPITLLQHKIYNVWIAFAQSTEDAQQVRIFDFPLLEVMELCGFDSNNRAFFIDAAKRLLDLRVEYASLERWLPSAADAADSARSASLKRSQKAAPARWAAAQLVSFIEIDNANGRMRIEFPEVLRNKILRPDLYRVIDLRKQKLFTSRPALALYEHVLRFAGERATPWLDWRDYSVLLSGSVEPHKTYREFSKVMQRAVDQVNAHHDSHSVSVELELKGRAVAKLRFVIATRENLRAAVDEEPDHGIITAMAALGVTPAAARTLARGHSREYLAAQIAYVAERQRRGRVQVAGAYLRTAIAANYANYAPGARSGAFNAPLPAPAVASEGSGAQTDDDERLLALSEIRAQIGALTAERRAALLDLFVPAANPIVKRSLAKSKEGSISTLVLHALADWIFESEFDLRGEWRTGTSEVAPSTVPV